MPAIKIEALLLHHIYYTSIFFCVLLPSLWLVMITCFWLFLCFCWSKGLIQYPLIEAREIFPWLQWTLDQISHFLKLPHPLRPQLSHFTLDNIVFTNGYFLTMKISLSFLLRKVMPAPLFISHLANPQELSKSGTLQEIDCLDECSISHPGWGHSLSYFRV